MSTSSLFLDAHDQLIAENAAFAMLVLDDGRYVMQLRDDVPGIFYPNHWGCFGGALDGDESAVAALKRELREELEYDVEPPEEFARFTFDLSRFGQKRVFRAYYEIAVPESAYRRFVLHEGSDFKAIEGRELLLQRRVTPYDSFAIWLHMSKARLTID